MRIGELAEVAGVSPDTIRYYERIGLMPSPTRTPAGYREYPSGAANRIRVIRNAVQLGFPLQEIAKVLRIRDTGGAPCGRVRDYARELVREVEQRIAHLQCERKAMVKMIKDWDRLLAAGRPDVPVHLLERPVAVRRPPAKHARLRRS